MDDKSGLTFHDSGQDDDVLFDTTDSQTHNFTNFPHSAVDDDEEHGDGDKSQLLKEEQKSSPSFWTFEYYQQFFNVDTHQVLKRVAGSMTPIPKRNYLETHIRPSPDLYGPFWICTTLVFTTAVAGNLANYMASAGKDYKWKYDFHKVTFAATAIFTYWWLLPTVLYGVLWWRKSAAGYTFLEMLCVYGYSLAIYIPISILWVINVVWLQWLLVILGAVLSGGVLLLTFWPAVKEDTKNVAIAVMALIFIFHLLLAAGFVMYFFHVPPRTSPIPIVPVTTHAPKLQQQLNTEAQKQDQKSQQALSLTNDGMKANPNTSPTTKQNNVGNSVGDKGPSTKNQQPDNLASNQAVKAEREDSPDNVKKNLKNKEH